MKNFVLTVGIVLMISTLSTHAQMNQGQDQQKDQQQTMMMQNRGAMQGGMQGGMMQDAMCPMHGMTMNQGMPMKEYKLLVNHLPEMQEELSLSEDQVNKLIDLRTQYQKQQIDYQGALAKEQMKTEKMLKDMSSASELKAQLKRCSDIMINMKVDSYETAKMMKALLTEEQKKSLEKSSWMQSNRMQGGMMQGDRMHGGMMH